MAGSSILLVNPRRKRRRVKSRTRARRRRRTITSHRRRRRRAVAAAPIRRRRRNPRHRARTRAYGGRRRRRLRNPRLGGLSLGRIGSMLVPAAMGGVGAIGLDVALAYIPIPEQYKTGWLGTGVKVAGAIGLGLLAGKVVGREKGKLFAAGALTVIAYQTIRAFASQAFGSTIKGLSGYQDFTDYRVGAYMNNGMGQLGYANPAAILRDSPMRARQMGAYMTSGSSEDMF